MNLQRDGDRIVLVIKARHLKTAGIGVGVVVIALGLALGGRTMRAARAAASADSLAWAAAPRFDVAVTGRPFKGSPDAPVTIVEFTDYLCPFCRRFATETLPAVLAGYGDRVRYVVRNFPVQPVNQMALRAAEAVECAHRQGRFWEYRAELFGEAAALDSERLLAHAGPAGLDSAGFGRGGAVFGGIGGGGVGGGRGARLRAIAGPRRPGGPRLGGVRPVRGRARHPGRGGARPARRVELRRVRDADVLRQRTPVSGSEIAGAVGAVHSIGAEPVTQDGGPKTERPASVHLSTGRSRAGHPESVLQQSVLLPATSSDWSASVL